MLQVNQSDSTSLHAQVSLAKQLNNKFVSLSAFVLLCIGTIIIIADSSNYRTQYTHQLNIISQSVVSHAQQDLAQARHENLEHAFTALTHESSIRRAVILSPEFSVLSEYDNLWLNQVTPKKIQQNILFFSEHVEVYQPIISDHQLLGHVFIIADLTPLQQRQKQLIALLFVVFISALVLLALLSHYSTARVTKPVVELSEFVNNINIEQDYNKRTTPNTLTEVNVLARGINAILESISGVQNALKVSNDRLSLVLLGGQEGLWDYDLMHNQLYLDRHSCAVLGLPEAETLLSSDQWYRMLHPKDVNHFKVYTHKFIKNRENRFKLEFRVKINRDWIWLRAAGEITYFGQDNAPERMTGTMSDITEQRNAEEKIKLYASVFDNTSDAIVILNSSLYVIAVNQAFTRITQYSQDEIQSQPLTVLHESEQSDEIRIQLNEKGWWSGEIQDSRKDGTEYILELALNTVKASRAQDFNYIVAVFSDITQRKRTEEELFFMANYDALTSLPNRAMFNNLLGSAIANAERHETRLALLFIDLDKFKQVNDTLGHDAGDELLVQSAKRFQKHIRHTDTVARLGGDEFTIILEDIGDSRQIHTIASAIQKDFQRTFNIGEHSANIGTSIGISIFPNDGDSSEALLKKSDTAMYFAKTNGRNSFHFFDKTMNAQAERRNTLEYELRQALENNEIRIHYQPKIDTSTMRVWGFEALVRWTHPSQGDISPFEFIPIAEEAGLIREIGLHVFRQASLQLQAWHAQGYTSLHMAVNVSAREFQLSDYPIEIAKILNDLDIDPQYIELELTESIVMDNPHKMNLMLDVIKSLGLSLSIDDFGTGYSSLSYLQRLPVDVLKVDQSFVRDIEDNPHSASIAKAIVSMAHSLGLTVVAEGVETQAQLDFFKQLRCELIQGYFFSKPLPLQQAEAYLHQHAIREHDVQPS